MNIKEYISSGIIESYVLGMASAEEAEEFERICASHAEVKEARDLFEQQLEQNAIAVGIQPPKKLKSLILSEIEIDAQKLGPKKIVAEPEPEKTTPIISFTPKFWKYLAAASIILLVGSTVLNFYFFNQYRKTNEQYTQLLANQTEMANTLNVMQTRAENYESALNMSNDTDMVVVKMPGVKAHPGNHATIYWDKRSKDVYLMANNLPVPPKGKQYQLWAMVNGQPVDAGLLDWEKGNMLTPIKNVQNAQAFAITLENEGGSPSPHLDQLFVYGNV